MRPSVIFMRPGMISVTAVSYTHLFAGELQKRIAKAGLPRADAKNGRVTVSIGVWRGSLEELDSFEVALKYADQALYDAKKAGRDCICYYNNRCSVQEN